MAEVVKSHTKEQGIQELWPAMQRGHQGGGHRNHTTQGGTGEKLQQVLRHPSVVGRVGG